MSVVIVGDGQAGVQAAISLRQKGYDRPITLVGEGQLPYQRPPLSKAFLSGALPAAQLAFRPRSFFETRDIELVQSRVERLDRRSGRAVLSDGTSLPFDSLILATGSRPRHLPVIDRDLSGVHYLHTVETSADLGRALRDCGGLVVIGGGFIGLEVASVARKMGVPTTVVEAGNRLMPRAVSRAVSDRFEALHRSAGVELFLDAGVTGVKAVGGDESVHTVCTTERDVAGELILIGIGSVPRTELAEQAGLPVDDGIVVDDMLRSPEDSRVFAVGDCCRFVDSTSGNSVRLECVQNAVEQATFVADAICGTTKPYLAVPWFWTEQLGVKLQIAGRLADGPQVVRGQGETLAVYSFTDTGRLACVETVNRVAEHLAARRVLRSAPALELLTLDEVARNNDFALADWMQSASKTLAPSH